MEYFESIKMTSNVNDKKLKQPYWIRLYNSLAMWVSLYLMIITLGFYLIAKDFSFAPGQIMRPHTIKNRNTLINPNYKTIKRNNQSNINKSNTMGLDSSRFQVMDENY